MKRSNMSVLKTSARRNAHLHAGATARGAALLEKIRRSESKATRLAPERAGADAQEESISCFEGRGIEITDQEFTLFPPIVIDGIDQILAQRLEVGEIRYFSRAEFLRERGFRSAP